MILMIRQIGRQKDFSCSKCQQHVRKIQLYFPQCHLLRCYQGLCNDIIEKNKDDDTDDPTDRKTERLKLFQMSTACQKDRKTDG